MVRCHARNRRSAPHPMCNRWPQEYLPCCLELLLLAFGCRNSCRCSGQCAGPQPLGPRQFHDPERDQCSGGRLARGRRLQFDQTGGGARSDSKASWNSISGYAFSTDGGANFTDGGFVPASGYRLKGDPALAFGPNGTTLYYASIGNGKNDAALTSRIFVSPSTSLSPVTFGAPVPFPASRTAHVQDKEMIAVDTTGGTFGGRVYVAWSEFPSGDPPNGPSRILFAASSSTTPLAFPTTQALSPHHCGEIMAPCRRWRRMATFTSFGVSSRPEREGRASRRRKQFKLSDRQTAVPLFKTQILADPNPSKTIASVTSDGRQDEASSGINLRTRGFPYIAIDQTPTGSPTRGNIYVVFQATPPSSGDLALSRYSSLAPLTAAKPGTRREASAMARR